ncbi:MAG: hypothetical protein LVQ97_04220 [Candidatus Micrarchaeales archaeon]|uniref:Uncharacterized protein n=1 Tax=Candidatus Micrarchaeum acidiphilum ARMAN-2 TaxID=425595 RepID=C7DH79_MICA2|nr:MAG: hypothetical protein UNLARM2_0425 [Candidatus Micrarchaeum acidiphilum ARMAN-2]MCW6161362.1 hypothetical protein [Candidatus Micrarchaeales archaeon]
MVSKTAKRNIKGTEKSDVQRASASLSALNESLEQISAIKDFSKEINLRLEDANNRVKEISGLYGSPEKASKALGELGLLKLKNRISENEKRLEVAKSEKEKARAAKALEASKSKYDKTKKMADAFNASNNYIKEFTPLAEALKAFTERSDSSGILSIGIEKATALAEQKLKDLYSKVILKNPEDAIATLDSSFIKFDASAAENLEKLQYTLQETIEDVYKYEQKIGRMTSSKLFQSMASKIGSAMPMVKSPSEVLSDIREDLKNVNVENALKNVTDLAMTYSFDKALAKVINAINKQSLSKGLELLKDPSELMSATSKQQKEQPSQGTSPQGQSSQSKQSTGQAVKVNPEWIKFTSDYVATNASWLGNATNPKLLEKLSNSTLSMEEAHQLYKDLYTAWYQNYGTRFGSVLKKYKGISSPNELSKIPNSDYEAMRIFASKTLLAYTSSPENYAILGEEQKKFIDAANQQLSDFGEAMLVQFIDANPVTWDEIYALLAYVKGTSKAESKPAGTSEQQRAPPPPPI